MRFHLLGLAHLPVAIGYPMCPFTPLIHGMAKMLMAGGHEVVLYGAHGSTAPCTEFVEVVSEGKIRRLLEARQPQVSHRLSDPEWQEYLQRCPPALAARYRAGDLALISYGNYQAFVPAIAPLHCEFIAGYSGVFTDYKVFPSSAWMHYIYGELHRENNPGWYDAVIPHYLDLSLYPDTPADPGAHEVNDYFLFLGRLVPIKGADIAAGLCQRAGKRLIVAGVDHEGRIPAWAKDYPKADFLGAVGHADKVKLLRHARALLVPSRFLEPFGMVVLEAMACGCPVITTDWGSFPELVRQGVTGWRCRAAAEFRQAMDAVVALDRRGIRDTASRSGLEALWPHYDDYFDRLQRGFAADWWNVQASLATGTGRGSTTSLR